MTPDLIAAARDRLKGHARVTPMLSSPFLDEIAGRRVLVKAECLQHTGSFKYRGARAAISALDPATRARGICAASSGNHAQGVALAAREMGVRAVMLMPADAPRIKLENTRALGAEVVTYDRATQDRDALMLALEAERGMTLVRPFDDAQVIAGQGTCGLEIAEQARDAGVETADVLVCCSGGGLTAGIAVALAREAPGLRVRPVEPEGFDDTARSLRSGRRETNPRQSGSLCDAILAPAPGELTLPVMLRHCGPGLTVTDDEALRAMALALLRLKIVVEPGGAAALAAALFCRESIQGEAVIVTASGGNCDPALLSRAMTLPQD
ncbi:threonine ammonia-lyase [Mangrovicoccus algicola]|uniref:Threonine/serine dehydratase n=1 Tax=Mangrovicoccus algicola TaxID=2771008 RepID=A0A8J6Z699_9RHOB|nr:threonine/serine dehydratase [Mangrovicoccus algicola]MBE3638589.1 threonine/serine dehydratase [Mangrovicoccus algicola]